MIEQNETKPAISVDEIMEGAALVAQAAELSPPDAGQELPTVRVDQPVSYAAREMGEILAASPLFRFGEDFVTICHDKGELELMKADRFRSWVETYLLTIKPRGKGHVPATMTKDFGALIMASDHFREKIREIKGINKVRLPAWRGKTKIKVSRSGPFWLKEGSDLHVELLPSGYDERTQIFTVELVKYQQDLPLREANDFINETLARFPWAEEDEIGKNRSLGVQFAAMLGVFCSTLFKEGTVRPMIVFNGNQPGSGKSLLMRMALAPVHGEPAESGKSGNEEFRKLLFSTAKAKKPYLALDDVSSLHSNDLNRFITTSKHEGRIMGGDLIGDFPAVTQVFTSGNQLILAEDLVRRSLVVDLFEPGKATERTFEKELTLDWLCQPKIRARFLAALWANVREWNKAGMPACKEARHTSASQWAGVIGAIVHHLNPKLQPFATRTINLGGDESGAALEALIIALASKLPISGEEFTTAQLIDKAEEMNLLEAIAGHAKDPRKAIGHRLKNLKGRTFRDQGGRHFQFGKRDKSFGAVYPFKFL